MGLSSNSGLKAPDLPGLRLVDPDISNWQGQVIYLDFNGAKGVTYHGPVTIGPFDIPAFSLEGTSWAGCEQTVITETVSQLQHAFAGTGVVFTVSRPVPGSECSTIYIGGDDSAFAPYGSFLGVAEQVDVGNADRDDNGIVFANRVLAATPYPTASEIAARLAEIAGHEVGHLLGMAHVAAKQASPGSSCPGLDDVAATTARWIGGSGNWSDPTHWDTPVVPNNSGSNTYNVVIDLAGSNPTITVDLDVTVDHLIDSEAVTIVGGQMTVKSGMELNGTLTLGTVLPGDLCFQGTQSLTGTGEVTFTDPGGSLYVRGVDSSHPATLTIGPGITIHGNEDLAGIHGFYANDTFVNQGTIIADRSNLVFALTARNWVNAGLLKASNGGTLSASGTPTLASPGTLQALSDSTLNWNGSAAFNGASRLVSQPGGTVTISGSLSGNTLLADLYAPQGTTLFDGSGTAAAPQYLEAMSRDLGATAAGTSHNFVYGTLALANNTYVRLRDQSDNAPGTGSEAVYANVLIVPWGTTLDLNGLHLYVRCAEIEGRIVGGTIGQIPDGGPVSFAMPTPGAIAVPGELDEWSFFDRGGHTVTVVVDTGTTGPPPSAEWSDLDYAEVRLLDASDHVLAAASNVSFGQTVSLNDVPLPADGNYRVRVRAPSGHTTATGQYMIAVWDVTADVAPLVLNQQVTGKIETPGSVDRWTFSAAAGQQVKFDLISTSDTGMAFDLMGPSSWTGFSGISGDSDLVTLPSSGTYTLTAHGTGGQYGGTYSFVMKQTSVTPLALGTPYHGTFAGSGQAQLFTIVVPVSATLKVVLDDSASNNANELYLKFGSAPTRGDYDYCFSTPAAADQQVLAPSAYPGTWYVLVYGDTIQTTSSYTLTATIVEVTIASVTPDHYAASSDAQITIRGGGFVNGATVELVSSGGTAYAATNIVVDSFQQITATFAAGSVPADAAHAYSVRVTEAGAAPAVLANAFQVLAGGQASLETNLVIPDSLGRHALATIYIEYANTGNAALPAPLLVLASGDPDDSDKPLLTLDESRVTDGFWTSATPEGFSHSIQLLATGNTPGVLQPGESFRVPVYYAGLQQPWDFSDDQVELNLGVLTADNTATVDWSQLKADLRPASISTVTWDADLAQFRGPGRQHVGQLRHHAGQQCQLPRPARSSTSWTSVSCSLSCSNRPMG